LSQGQGESLSRRAAHKIAGGFIAFVLLALLTAQILISIYMLLRLFPLAIDVQNNVKHPLEAQFFFDKRTFTPDQVYLWNVAAAGALGAAISSALVIDKYVKRLHADALAHFFTRLLVGISLPVISYAAVRGGLMNIDAASSSDLNPYTIVASAGIVGMFTERAVKQLKTAAFKPQSGRVSHR
jgi:hypothetical protein